MFIRQKCYTYRRLFSATLSNKTLLLESIFNNISEQDFFDKTRYV